jgi:hypothetical protein
MSAQDIFQAIAVEIRFPQEGGKPLVILVPTGLQHDGHQMLRA